MLKLLPRWLQSVPCHSHLRPKPPPPLRLETRSPSKCFVEGGVHNTVGEVCLSAASGNERDTPPRVSLLRLVSPIKKIIV